MHFCENCGNMYYIKLGDQDNLHYYCRKCGNENKKLINELKNFCVSKTHIIKESKAYNNIINEYTHLDPTLPRANNIKCPNEQCMCNTDKKVDNDIIYLRYDNANMKYIYLCVHCKSKWKITE